MLGMTGGCMFKNRDAEKPVPGYLKYMGLKDLRNIVEKLEFSR